MLKILFTFLLLLNGGLLAYQQGYLDPWPSNSREPSRLTQQLNGEQLKLLPPSAAKSPAAAGATPAPEIEKNPAGTNEIPELLGCTEIGNFDLAEARRFETQLTALALGERLTRRVLPENVRHMVYMPPLADKEMADRKAAELKRLGVQDFFVIQDGSALQWGISLGVFKSEEAARQHLAALNQKGVRSARIGTHQPAAQKFAFQLRGLDAAATDSVNKIRDGFPRQELRACSGTLAG